MGRRQRRHEVRGPEGHHDLARMEPPLKVLGMSEELRRAGGARADDGRFADGSGHEGPRAPAGREIACGVDPGQLRSTRGARRLARYAVAGREALAWLPDGN